MLHRKDKIREIHMPTMFEKKAENNEQAVSLLAKPRLDLIDSEHEKIKPLMTQVLGYVEKLKEYESKPLSEACDEISLHMKDFELLLKKINYYRDFVLNSPSFDQLGMRSITYSAWLQMTKDHIETSSFNKYDLKATIENFENLDGVVQNAIVCKKESLILQCNKLLNKKSSCTIS